MASLSKQPYKTVGPFTIWFVNGRYIRDHLDIDFTDGGGHWQYPSFIPRGELWLDEAVGAEAKFVLDYLLAEFKALNAGLSRKKAIQVALRVEQHERSKHNPQVSYTSTVTSSVRLKQLPIPKLLAEQGLSVWLINGPLVRKEGSASFTQGGHHLVYPFIPPDQIWIDDDYTVEAKFIVLHELVEHTLMRTKGYTYEKAHERANHLEWKARQKKASSELPKPTQAMVKFFKERTKLHRELTAKYLLRLKGVGGLIKEDLVKRATKHDTDKYSPSFVLPYIWVTEYYRVKNSTRKVPDQLQAAYDSTRSATGQHVKLNRHHPEYWGADLNAMTTLDLAEMVADWSAMAEELGQGSARGWADDHVGSKWKWDKPNTDLIYQFIDHLEKQNLNKVAATHHTAKWKQYNLKVEAKPNVRLANTTITTPQQALKYCHTTIPALELQLKANHTTFIVQFNRWVAPLTPWVQTTRAQVKHVKIYRSTERTKLQNLYTRLATLDILTTTTDNLTMHGVWDRLTRIPNLIASISRMADRIQDYTTRPKEMIHGNFTVINNFGYTTEEIAGPLSVLDATTEKIKDAGFSQVLYGTIVLGNKAPRDNWAGTYIMSADLIELAQNARHRFDIVYTLVHEFGHREWYKFLTPEQQQQYEAAYAGTAQYRLTVEDRQRFWNALLAVDFNTRRLPQVLSAEEAAIARSYYTSQITKEIRDLLRSKRMAWEMWQDLVDNTALFRFVRPNTPLVYPTVKSVSVTDYGDTSVKEDFAEVFAHVVLGMQVKPDALTRFTNATQSITELPYDPQPMVHSAQYASSISLQEINQRFPVAHSLVDGREVRNAVPNVTSISASLDVYTVLKGIREVKMSEFDEAIAPKNMFYALDDLMRSEHLAKEIARTNEIAPLIIVLDEDPHPYILEGGHRAAALYLLGAKSFPAVVVVDESEKTGAIIYDERDPRYVEQKVASYRIGYKTKAPSWKIATEQLKRTTQRLKQIAEECKSFSSENSLDFFGRDAQYQAESVCQQLQYLVKILDKVEWFLENSATFSQLQEMLGYTQEHLDRIEQRYPKFRKAVEERYDNFYQEFDPQNPVPQDSKVAAEWEEYYNFTTKILPLLKSILALPPLLANVEKFHGYVDTEIEYRNKVQQNPQYPKSGDPHPPGVQQHEVMYHTTVAYRAILRDGFKLRSEQNDASAGLGGSMDTGGQEGISFTASREVAEGIAEAYSDMVTLLQGPKTVAIIQRYIVNVLGLDYTNFLKQTRSLFKPTPDETGHYSLVQVYNFVRYGLAYSDYAGVRYDPLFMDMGNASAKLANLAIEDIGIVEATINTTDPHVSYARSMEEWRVPKEAIISYGPVGSQSY